MFYTVQEISKVLSVSRVTIYNKLKVKDMEPYISKNDKGITYISEEGVKWLRDNVNLQGTLQDEVSSDLNTKDIDDEETKENQGCKDDVNFTSEYVNYLKEDNQRLWQQVQDLTRMLENSQVLLKEKPQQDPLLLEERFINLEEKLEEIKDSMKNRQEESKKKKSLWDKLKNK